MGQNIIAPNYAFDSECLRAIGINFADSWNHSANFANPRGLQGGALKLLGKEISKEIEIHFRPLSSVPGNSIPHPRLGKNPISKLADI